MSSKLGTLCIVLTAIAFGTMEISLKIAGTAFTPFQLTFLRFLVGGLLLMPLAIRDLKKRSIHLDRSDWGYLAVLGLINICFSMIFFQIGVNMANAGLAAIVFSSNPIFVMIFSYFIIHEAFTRKKAITLVLSLIGLVIVANPMAIIRSGNIGLLVSLAAAVSFALYTTLGKLRIEKLGGNVENAFSFLIGCVFLLFLLLFHGDPIVAGIDSHTVWSLIYCSLVVTGFGYLCFMKAVELTGPSNASFAFFIKPIIALILSAIILSEPITVNAVVGLALILLGCTMAGPIEHLLFRHHAIGEIEGRENHPAWIKEDTESPLVITISREYGSGGRNIGKLVARQLGIPYYDTEILNLTRKEHPQTFAAWCKDRKRLLGPLLTKVYDDYIHYASGYESKQQEMFRDEAEVIQGLTAGKSCVIVGRLANYILRKRPNTFNVFISSDPDWAIQRIMLREHVDADKARKIRNHVNHERRDHCMYCTDSYWGYGANYDLSLKSSDYGVVKTADLILQAAQHRLTISKEDINPAADHNAIDSPAVAAES
jgi:drug/metabolite transporter (DMT)-like permease/cytidylate kinase